MSKDQENEQPGSVAEYQHMSPISTRLYQMHMQDDADMMERAAQLIGQELEGIHLNQIMHHLEATLRPIEYRRFLMELYYKLATQDANSKAPTDIIDMIEQSLVREVDDALDYKYDLRFKHQPDQLNEVLDVKMEKRHMLLMERIKLAASRLDAMTAAAMTLGRKEQDQQEEQE